MSALTKLIDFLGLTAQTEELVNAMDAKDADNLQAAKSYADTVAAAAGSSAAASSIPLSQKGTPGGVAELNSQGIVPSHQLPSFVDDVIEGYRLGPHFYSDAAHTTIITDETGKSSDQLSGKIYVDLGDNKTYRWAGSDYTVISESLALGTTEATAGRGDWTYTAYQHALAKGSQFANNLYKITTNTEGHVVAATPVTKQDIVDLGIPGSDTVYEDATTTTHGLMSATDKAKLDGVESGAQVNPSDATTTAHGLMSAADKAKLDGIEANANNYSLPTMSPTTKGGAKLGSGLSMDGEALNLGPLTDSGSGASVQTDGCGIFGVTGEGWAEQDTTTGKNLLPNNLVDTTVSGVTFTKLPDGGIKVYGMETGSNSGTDIGQVTLEPGTYTGSIGGRLVGNLRFTVYSPSTHTVYASLANGSKTFTVQSQDTVHVYFTSTGSNYQLEDTVIYPQLEAGSTATGYEPYTGGKASPSPDYPQEIRVARGRNIAIPFNNSKTISGITITPQEDGSVLLNGTSTSDGAISVTDQNPKVSAGITYTASIGNYAGTGISNYGLTGFSTNKTITPTNGFKWCGIHVYIPNGVTVSNVRIYPQIELATPTPYVPYGHVGLEVLNDKNLAEPNVTANRTHQGVAWSYLGNGEWNVVGSTDGNTSFPDASSKSYKAHLIPGEYVASVRIDGEISGGVRIGKGASSSFVKADDNGVTAFTVASEDDYYILPYIPANTHVNGVVTVQLEDGLTPTFYIKYGYHTTTPIPLPSKGFAASLPDGTADALTVDSAGRWEWVNKAAETVFDGSSDENWSYDSGGGRFSIPIQGSVQSDTTHAPSLASRLKLMAASATHSASTDGFTISSGSALLVTLKGSYPSIASASDFKTWLSTHNVTVLYPLAEQTTESGYIELPELPAGATVSIPELEAIGVEWWVEGAEAIAEHGRDTSKANKEQEDRIAELEAKFASLGIEETIVNTNGNVTVTYTNGLHVGYNKETFNMYTLPATPMGVSDKWIYNYDEHES